MAKRARIQSNNLNKLLALATKCGHSEAAEDEPQKAWDELINAVWLALDLKDIDEARAIVLEVQQIAGYVAVVKKTPADDKSAA